MLPINARTGKAGKTIKLGAGNDAVGVAVTPDGNTLLVTTYDPRAAAPGQGEVMAISTKTDTVRARLMVAVKLWRPTDFEDTFIMPLLALSCQIDPHIPQVRGNPIHAVSGSGCSTLRCIRTRRSSHGLRLSTGADV